MSFPRAALKRFNEVTGCAPPPGTYEPKKLDKGGGIVVERTDRFKESKDEIPGPGAFEVGASMCKTPIKSLFAKPVVSGRKAPKNATSSSAKGGEKEPRPSEQASKKHEEPQRELFPLKLQLQTKDEEICKLQQDLDLTMATLLDDLQMFEGMTVTLEQNVQAYGTFVAGLLSETVPSDVAQTEKGGNDSKAVEELSQKLKDEKTALEMKVKLARKSSEKLQQRFNRAVAEVESLKAPVQNNIVKLQETKDALEKQLQEVENIHLQTHKEDADRILSLEQQEFSAKAAAEDLHCQITALQEETEELKRKISEKENDLIAIQEENDNIVSSVQEQEQKWEYEKRTFLQQVETLMLEKSRAESATCDSEEKLKILMELKEQSDREVERFQEQLKSEMENREDLQSKMGDLVYEKSQLEMDIGRLEARIKMTNIESDQVKRQADQALKHIPELTERLNTVLLEKEQVDREVQELGKLNSEMQGTMEDFQSDFDMYAARAEADKQAANTKIISLTEEVDGLKEQKDQMARDFDEWLMEKSELEIELAKLQCRVKVLEMEDSQSREEEAACVNNYKSQLERVTAEKKQMERDMEQYGIDLLSNAAEIQSLQAKLLRTEEECEKLTAEYSSEKESLTGEITSLNQQVSATTESLHSKTEECDKLMKQYNAEKERLSAEITDLQQKLTSTEETLQRKTEECEKMSRRVEQQAAELTDLGQEISELNDQFEEAQNSLISQQKENAELEQRNIEIDEELTKSVSEVEGLRQHLKSIQSAHKETFTQAQEAYESEIDSLRQQLESRIDPSDVESLTTDLEKYKQLYEDLHAKVGPFMEQIESFALEKQALLGQSKNYEKELEKLSGDFANLLGHQNQKQKIRHIVKIKEENNSLKKEVQSLRDQCAKFKHTVDRLQEKERPRRFDPSKAFNAGNGKENKSQALPLREANKM